jgi:hypothetical protein
MLMIDGPCSQKRLSPAPMPAARAIEFENIVVSGKSKSLSMMLELTRQGKTGFAKRSVKQYSEAAQ